MGKEPKKMVDMILMLNKVGKNKLKSYSDSKRGKRNFDRDMEIIRYAARYGYTDCGKKYDLSKQRIEQILKRWYTMACECLNVE